MSPSDDAALARAAQAGDVNSLSLLLERHRALLYAVAVGLLGHGPAAEDAVHETFVIALRRFGDLRDPGAARSWLLSVLGNVCREELRRPAAEPRAEITADPPDAGALDPVAEELERVAVREWVWAAIGRLSEPLRLVVVLRYFSRASSYEAIAGLCGIPVGTVRSRLSAARAKLASELLDVAAASHGEPEDHDRLALQTLAAMKAFERSGDPAPLREVLAPDLRFRLADGVERQGLDLYASLLAADFEDGVTIRPAGAVAGPGLVVADVWLDNPRERPDHCPPGLTQVAFHDGRITRRVVGHYAERPGPPS